MTRVDTQASLGLLADLALDQLFHVSNGCFALLAWESPWQGFEPGAAARGVPNGAGVRKPLPGGRRPSTLPLSGRPKRKS